ncbi:MAG: hypothetical protein RIR79_2031 [Pseudomonadota bacterium]
MSLREAITSSPFGALGCFELNHLPAHAQLIGWALGVTALGIGQWHGDTSCRAYGIGEQLSVIPCLFPDMFPTLGLAVNGSYCHSLSDRYPCPKAKSPPDVTPWRALFLILAEKVGFEPTVGSPLRLISSQVHSTTLPLLLKLEARILADD